MDDSCGVCGKPLGFWDRYVIKSPVGSGFVKFDRRPKSATGGRIGSEPDYGVRKFVRTENLTVCVGCSKGQQLVDWPGKDKFESRSKRR